MVFPQRSSIGGVQRLRRPKSESRSQAVHQRTAASFTLNDLSETEGPPVTGPPMMVLSAGCPWSVDERHDDFQFGRLSIEPSARSQRDDVASPPPFDELLHVLDD